jgi:hypothetical protein
VKGGELADSDRYDQFLLSLFRPPGETWDEADDRWLGYLTGAAGTLAPPDSGHGTAPDPCT